MTRIGNTPAASAVAPAAAAVQARRGSLRSGDAPALRDFRDRSLGTGPYGGQIRPMLEGRA